MCFVFVVIPSFWPARPPARQPSLFLRAQSLRNLFDQLSQSDMREEEVGKWFAKRSRVRVHIALLIITYVTLCPHVWMCYFLISARMSLPLPNPSPAPRCDPGRRRAAAARHLHPGAVRDVPHHLPADRLAVQHSTLPVHRHRLLGPSPRPQVVKKAP